jgi:hypothetical protein
MVAGRDARAALDDAFQASADAAAQRTRAVLRQLLQELARASSEIAAATRVAAGPIAADFDLDADVRELPVPSLPVDLRLVSLGAERVLGKAATRAVLSRKLEQAAGAAVRASVESYASVLRRWALDRLERIRREWASAADVLRAAVDRSLGHAERPPVNRDELARDLQRLG